MGAQALVRREEAPIDCLLPPSDPSPGWEGEVKPTYLEQATVSSP